MNTILSDDERPKLPFSPYLFTEWRSAEERVSNTMYTADHMREYADAREAAVVAKLREQEPVAQITDPGSDSDKPSLKWSKPWHQLERGSKLYTTPQPAVAQVPQDEYQRNVMSSLAHWLETRSYTIWAKEGGHDGLMRIYAADLRAMLDAAPEATAQAMSEREAFQAWVRRDRDGNVTPHPQNPNRYASATVQGWWQAWQARAALAQQPAAWVEAVKVAREALSLALSDVDWRRNSPTQKAIHKAYNRIAQLDALTKEQP